MATEERRRSKQNYNHVSSQEEGEYDERDDALSNPDGCTSSLHITIDEAIERIGMGKFQIWILFASGLCFAADAMQVILLSFLTVVLRKEWELTEQMAAFLTSGLFAGSMLGTLVLGPLADNIGRRPVFLIAGMVISIFGTGASMAINYWIFVCQIFMVGFGVGGLTVPFDILAEFLPSSRRGTNLLLIEYFWTIGCLYVVFLAEVCLQNNQWRAFVLLCSVPCMVSVFIGFNFVPESARWLAAEGCTDQALQILRQAAEMNGHDADTIFPSGTQIQGEEKEQEASVCDLFTPKWREITLRLWGTWGAFAFGYYGVLLAITRVFADSHSAGAGSLEVNGDRQYNFDYSAIFVSSSAELVGTTLVILAVDKVGRIPSQVVSYLCAGVAVCVLCVLAQSGSPRLMLIAIGFLARVFEMGGTCVTWVSTAEILTTEVRASGHSTANAVARLGAIFAPLLVEGNDSLTKIGVIILIVHLFTVVCVYKLPETKGHGMGVTPTRSHLSDHHDLALINDQAHSTDAETERELT